MKKFYIIDTKDNNAVIASIEATNEKEARKATTQHYLDKVLSGGIVVASESRYRSYYSNN